MKNEKILHAIGQIDDDLIEDAIIQKTQKNKAHCRMSAFRRVVALAACFALVLGLTLSVTTLLNQNNEAPNVGITGPGTEGLDATGADGSNLPSMNISGGHSTLLPPTVQTEEGVSISGLDELAYYAAICMIAGEPNAINQSMFGGNYGISLLTNNYGTDKRDEPPMPETTGPEETQGPPVTSNASAPTDSEEDIFYYALDPNEPFFINKVSMFQIELTDENGFLASKLGLGIVDVVIAEDCIWGDSLIIFRNGDKFYSCLSNGWHLDQQTGDSKWDFSTHKYVEGFFIVKNFEHENYAFYIDMDAEGQAVAFECLEAQNGGYRADQHVRIASTTLISTHNASFTIAELEEYCNTIMFPEGTTPVNNDLQQPTTNLEF